MTPILFRRYFRAFLPKISSISAKKFEKERKRDFKTNICIKSKTLTKVFIYNIRRLFYITSNGEVIAQIIPDQPKRYLGTELYLKASIIVGNYCKKAQRPQKFIPFIKQWFSTLFRRIKRPESMRAIKEHQMLESGPNSNNCTIVFDKNKPNPYIIPFF